MSKPFKNLKEPASNTNASTTAPTLSKDPVPSNRTINEERVNEDLRDGEKPIAWPAVENGPKPMRFKNGG